MCRGKKNGNTRRQFQIQKINSFHLVGTGNLLTERVCGRVCCPCFPEMQYRPNADARAFPMHGFGGPFLGLWFCRFDGTYENVFGAHMENPGIPNPESPTPQFQTSKCPKTPSCFLTAFKHPVTQTLLFYLHVFI